MLQIYPHFVQIAHFLDQYYFPKDLGIIHKLIYLVRLVVYLGHFVLLDMKLIQIFHVSYAKLSIILFGGVINV